MWGERSRERLGAKSQKGLVPFLTHFFHNEEHWVPRHLEHTEPETGIFLALPTNKAKEGRGSRNQVMRKKGFLEEEAFGVGLTSRSRS